MVSYSHIHVINAQLAVEVFADVATKPDGLRKNTVVVEAPVAQ